MITYEVNLRINNEIFTEYYDWLMEHIGIMLQFEGFNKAEIAKEKIPVGEVINLTVRYFVEKEENLDDYFQNHAAVMREEGFKRFGTKFTATRRIFAETMSLYARIIA